MSKLQIVLLIDAIFFMVAFILIFIGVMIKISYKKKSVEVDADCIDVKIMDYHYDSIDFDGGSMVMKNAKMPTYEYWYNGRKYQSSPRVYSNMPGYQPKIGPCKIRINKNKPERIYYSTPDLAVKILVGIGLVFIVSASAVSAIVL